MAAGVDETQQRQLLSLQLRTEKLDNERFQPHKSSIPELAELQEIHHAENSDDDPDIVVAGQIRSAQDGDCLGRHEPEL